MVNMKNLLGNKIRNYRLECNLSQDELARKAEVPYTTLTKIETGVIKSPSVFTIRKITKALNITMDKLIE